MGLLDKCAEILQGAVVRVHVFVVGNVVALVHLGGRIKGREPHAAHAQLFQVFQFGADADKIADSVTVAVAEARHVDLIKNGVLPPLIHKGSSFR